MCTNVCRNEVFVKFYFIKIKLSSVNQFKDQLFDLIQIICNGYKYILTYKGSLSEKYKGGERRINNHYYIINWLTLLIQYFFCFTGKYFKKNLYLFYVIEVNSL